MLRLHKILYPTDFSDAAERALPHALAFARAVQAELHMLHIVVLHQDDPYNPAHHFPDVDTIHRQLKQQAADQLHASLEAHDTDDLVIKQVQRRDVSAAPAIVAYAEEEDIDLIVISSHGRRGARRLLLGSVTEEVIRMAACPVLAVPPGSTAAPAVRQILVPIDFSEHAPAALAAARQVAAAVGARLQLLHVLEDVLHPAFYQMGATRLKDLQPDIEERTEEALKQLVKEGEGPDVETAFFAEEGHAARHIVHFAEEHGSDLIVLTTHGLSGWDQLLLGSTAEKVLRRAHCPVLVLKASAEAAEAGRGLRASARGK